MPHLVWIYPAQLSSLPSVKCKCPPLPYKYEKTLFVFYFCFILVTDSVVRLMPDFAENVTVKIIFNPYYL